MSPAMASGLSTLLTAPSRQQLLPSPGLTHLLCLQQQQHQRAVARIGTASGVLRRGPPVCCSVGSDDLQLVKSHELQDGSTLFVFGTADEAHQATVAQPESSETVSPPSNGAAGSNLPVEPAHAGPSAADGTSAAAAPAVEVAISAIDKPQHEPKQRRKRKTAKPVALAARKSEPHATPSQDGAEEVAGHAVQSDGALTHEHLSTLKVADLRGLCKVHSLKGYSKLKKEELVELLLSAQSTEPVAAA